MKHAKGVYTLVNVYEKTSKNNKTYYRVVLGNDEDYSKVTLTAFELDSAFTNKDKLKKRSLVEVEVDIFKNLILDMKLVPII